jgi:hypothetical protein
LSLPCGSEQQARSDGRCHYPMNNLSTAARLGRLTGITYRETAKVVRLIDWAEVGAIVLHMSVALVVCTYLLGKCTGEAVHGANARLARLWVRLWVPGAEVLASTPDQPIQPAPSVKESLTVAVPVPDSAVVTVELARQMLAQGLSQRAVSRELAIPRTTLRRMLAKA